MQVCGPSSGYSIMTLFVVLVRASSSPENGARIYELPGTKLKRNNISHEPQEDSFQVTMYFNGQRFNLYQLLDQCLCCEPKSRPLGRLSLAGFREFINLALLTMVRNPYAVQYEMSTSMSSGANILYPIFRLNHLVELFLLVILIKRQQARDQKAPNLYNKMDNELPVNFNTLPNHVLQ